LTFSGLHGILSQKIRLLSKCPIYVQKGSPKRFRCDATQDMFLIALKRLEKEGNEFLITARAYSLKLQKKKKKKGILSVSICRQMNAYYAFRWPFRTTNQKLNNYCSVMSY
jgi:hypothetical protein